jgi:molecular chaperone DnaJ
LIAIDILGVPRDASQAEIKRSFLILAKKFHPDVNNSKDAVKKFSEINEAYQTLEDEGKRKMYDLTGLSANEQDNVEEQFNTSGFGFDPFSKVRSEQALEREFDELEKEFKEFFSMDFTQSSNDEFGKIRGRDLNGSLSLTFEEAWQGCTKTFPAVKFALCKLCDGSTTDPRVAPSQCEQCGGQGIINGRKCAQCKGAGVELKECPECNGHGFGKVVFNEQVVVPKGVYDGVTLRIRGKGNETKSGNPGDILLKVEVKPSPIFKTQGNNLVLNKKVTATQAILGDTIKV